MGNDYRYIGKHMPRQDSAEIVTGTAPFLDDLKFPNLLYGKVLRSPHAHALIQKIDKSKAEALPGVKAVTWEDIPTGGAALPKRPRIQRCAMSEIQCPRAATSEQIAEEALSLIGVEYEVLPAVLDIDSALKPDAPQLYEGFKGNIVPAGTPIYGPNCLTGVVRGDVDTGLLKRTSSRMNLRV
jgi:xanthine dehydrogenase molybdenum-binding subunit